MRVRNALLNAFLIALVVASVVLTGVDFMRIPPSGAPERVSLGVVPPSPVPEALPLVLCAQGDFGARVAYAFMSGYLSEAHEAVRLTSGLSWQQVRPDRVQALVQHPYLRLDTLPAVGTLYGLPPGAVTIIETATSGIGILAASGDAYFAATPSAVSDPLQAILAWMAKQGLPAEVVQKSLPVLVPEGNVVLSVPALTVRPPDAATLLRGYFLDPLAVHLVQSAEGPRVYTDGRADLVEEGDTLSYLLPASQSGQNVHGNWQALQQFFTHHPGLPPLFLSQLDLQRLDGVSGVSFTLWPIVNGLPMPNAIQAQAFLGAGQMVSVTVEPLSFGPVTHVVLAPPDPHELRGVVAVLPAIQPSGVVYWVGVNMDGTLHGLISTKKVAA